MGTNQLAAAGLPPGEAVTITLPSCIGIYEVSAMFADGRVVAHPDLNATTIRELVVR